MVMLPEGMLLLLPKLLELKDLTRSDLLPHPQVMC